MNFKKIGLIFCLTILIHFSIPVYAEESLIDMVKSKAETAKGVAQNSQSTANIPGYSEKAKQQVEEHLNNLEVGIQINQLKNEGAKLRNSEVANNPEGTIATMVEATDLKRVKGFEGYSELDMFKEADKYMQDPVGQMDLLKNAGCKEQVNSKKRGFIRKEKKETITDEIEEVQSCEVPMTNFKCKKTLEVSCKKTSECEYGGITKDSIDKGITFDSSNGFLTIGTDGDNYLNGICATHDRTVVFSMAQVDLIESFHLIHVKFDDYLQLTLNGHIVYVGPDGGTHVEVKDTGGGWLGGNKVFNGHSYHACERGTNWNRGVNIDLRPYLIEGKNTLQMRIIVSGQGEGWLKIKAMKQCCAKNDWQETWVEHCEQER